MQLSGLTFGRRLLASGVTRDFSFNKGNWSRLFSSGEFIKPRQPESQFLLSAAYQRQSILRQMILQFPVSVRKIRPQLCVALGPEATRHTSTERDNQDAHVAVWIGSPKEEWNNPNSPVFFWIKKLWVPALVVMTIATGWRYPLSLFVSLVFLVWTTKPAPSSIHVWLQQREDDEMNESTNKSGWDRLKAQLNQVYKFNQVEVEDNILFCTARVSSISQTMVVIGILGDWWVIYSASRSFSGF